VLTGRDFVEAIRLLPDQYDSRGRHVATLKKAACARICGFTIGYFALDLCVREKFYFDIRERTNAHDPPQ
jgi:hypothetical protein